MTRSVESLDEGRLDDVWKSFPILIQWSLKSRIDRTGEVDAAGELKIVNRSDQ